MKEDSEDRGRRKEKKNGRMDESNRRKRERGERRDQAARVVS